ncbi:sigma-54 interaction domain-containing protein [Neobacillus massiliamazoniensis]|uniref:HTH-type transcriptional regulatory protein TyrR n=1 Tax=Neobacillus massiliamazoniensis TaxID=1499688 RepID=A0A0U1NYD2_9BACI|nr:sigma 54-interacting transcriptional regulator [Neobacillus massiliamazoniensis]CRK83040.1 sigma-54 dependent transcriptional regulator [Neobacillus massiliamazoniensis]
MKVNTDDSLQTRHILDHILEHSFDEIFIADPSGIVLYTSQSTEKVYGIPSEQIINHNIFELEKQGLFSPSVIANVLRTNKKDTLIQETKRNRKLIISGYPINDESGKLIGAISIARDMTEFEFLKKENEQVAKALQIYQEEIEKLRKQSTLPFSIKDRKMEKVFEVVSKIANINVTVLLEGESGVGKNHIANAIHQMSERKHHPFIEVNCGAIPHSLFESELFGYEEGAFTGSKKGGKKGYFEAAGEGTLFLDEIGELPMNLQVKLLSVLQNHTFMRIGGTKQIEVKCRIICATNQDLEIMMKEKRFREDLYYRINVVKIEIPPLRERKEEIIPLIYEITEQMNQKYNLNKHFTPTMLAWLSQQTWPGNVRELRNYIEKKIITTSSNELDLEIDEEEPKKSEDNEMPLNDYIEILEKEYIVRMYQKYRSSIKLAEKLGISQSTANRKIQKYVMER